MPPLARIIRLRQDKHLLWLLTNLYPYRRTSLLKSRGDALYRHWPGLSASAKAGTYLWLLTNQSLRRRTPPLKRQAESTLPPLAKIIHIR